MSANPTKNIVIRRYLTENPALRPVIRRYGWTRYIWIVSINIKETVPEVLSILSATQAGPQQTSVYQKKVYGTSAILKKKKKKKKKKKSGISAIPKKCICRCKHTPNNYSTCFLFIKVWLSIFFLFIFIYDCISNISALNRFYFNGIEPMHSRNRAVKTK